jgi:hypothetical protein
MAYDASQSDRPQAQTLGSTPLSERQPLQGTETPQDGSQTGSTTPSSSPEQNPNKAPQRASSGMFTNIQNYISKNQPQSAKMADAASKSMEKTAQAVQGKAGQLGQRFQGMATASAPKNLDTAVDTVKTAAQQAAEYTSAQPQNAPQFDTSKDDEIKDILTMQYKGPTDLRSIQGYGDVSNEATKAQQLMDTVKSGNRSQLLKQMFGQNREYTTGQRNLDDLVLGKNIAQVQDKVQQLGPMSGVLDQAQQQASTFAQERADEILGVRGEARDALTGVAQSRQQQIDTRLQAIQDNWQAMPDHFKAIFNKAKSGVQLSNEEANILGVREGAGIYNLAKDPASVDKLIRASALADKSQLVNKDEFDQLSRLQALTNLVEGGLGFNNAFTDRSIAGSKTLADSLDTANFQSKMYGAEKKFREDAKDKIKATGRGRDTYDKGLFQTGTIKKKAKVDTTLKDVLSNSGYDFNQPISYSLVDPNINYLKALESSVNTSYSPDAKSLDGADAMNFSTSGALGGPDLSLENIRETGVDIGKGITHGAGDIADTLLNLGGALPGLGNLGVGKSLGKLGGDVVQGFDDLSSKMFGGGKARAKARAEYKAQKEALKKLEEKVKKEIKASGVKNRVEVVKNKETDARMEALKNLLAGNFSK